MNSNSTVATLPASDIDRAKDFYRDTLGLSVTSEFPGGVNFGDGSNQLAVYQAGGTSPGTFTQVTFMVDDVPALVADLRAKGVEFQEYDMPQLKTEDGVATGPDGSKLAWFKDSEGNIAGIIQPA